MRSLFIFVFGIWPVLVFAQNNFKEGYVITAAGDTLRGLINYREWYLNPTKIEFKKSTDGNVIEVTPLTAKQVSIKGYEVYESFDVIISMNKVRFEEIADTANTASVTRKVFLKQLVTGNFVNLYSYADKLKERFYVLDAKKSTPEELLLVKSLQDMQEETQTIYRKQLVRLANTYGTYTSNLEARIQSVAYTESGLKNVVAKINTNSTSTVKTENGNAKSSTYFAGIGIMQVRISYTGRDIITIDGLNPDGSQRFKDVTTTNISPRIAAGINFYSKLWLHKLSIKAEVSAYHFSSTVESNARFNGSTAENHYTFNFEGWRFTLTPQVLYKLYNTANVKAYVGAGPGINILAATKNSSYKVGINQPLTYNETTNDFMGLKNISIILTGRAGVLINNKYDVYIYAASPAQYNYDDPKVFSVKSGVVALCAAYSF